MKLFSTVFVMLGFIWGFGKYPSMRQAGRACYQWANADEAKVSQTYLSKDKRENISLWEYKNGFDSLDLDNADREWSSVFRIINLDFFRDYPSKEARWDAINEYVGKQLSKRHREVLALYRTTVAKGVDFNEMIITKDMDARHCNDEEQTKQYVGVENTVIMKGQYNPENKGLWNVVKHFRY